MRFILSFLILFCNAASAQDGCDKCSMLREEYELAMATKKEELYKYFKSECLETETVFVSEEGIPQEASKASSYQVIAYGKCIPYREVMQYDKTSKKITASYKIDKDTIYTIGSTVPQFPGGDTELIKFLRANLKKPAGKMALPVTIYAKFVVQKNGEITDIRITRSGASAYNGEAIRLIKSMPAWAPGTYRGKAVAMFCTIPVKFP